MLFIFIHAVKAFHTHDFPPVQFNSASKNATTVKSIFFCAICDFQLAKDSDAEVATLEISAQVHFVVPHYNYTLPQLYNFSVTSSVRGPPAFIS